MKGLYKTYKQMNSKFEKKNKVEADKRMSLVNWHCRMIGETIPLMITLDHLQSDHMVKIFRTRQKLCKTLNKNQHQGNLIIKRQSQSKQYLA